MTTARKLKANQQNALLSTGPSSGEGKAITRMNAVTHGLRASGIVVPGENQEEWEQFHGAYVAALSPCGLAEVDLASRAAGLSWRLRRIERFEANAVTAASDEAARIARGELTLEEMKIHFLSGNSDAPPSISAVETEINSKHHRAAEISEYLGFIRRLPGEKGKTAWDGADAVGLLRELLSQNDERLGPDGPQDNEEFFESIGVPAIDSAMPEFWDGWTSAAVKRGVGAIARALGLTTSSLLTRASKRLSEAQDGIGPTLNHLGWRLEKLRDTLRRAEVVARQSVLLPPAHILDPLMRYEAHLRRQLSHVLGQLAMLQEDRPQVVTAKVGVYLEPSTTVESPSG